ncbi:hypothetical protein JYT72_00970 [Crocinitomix catalasitica]|nr:hypothetical protein [Crocinitomix catalasitica]
MKFNRIIPIGSILIFLSFSLSCQSQINPKVVVEKAVNAHGGMENWRSKGSVEYELKVTKFNEQKEISSESLINLKFPTSGQANYEGNFDGIKMKYTEGITEVRSSTDSLILDEALHAKADYKLPTMNYIWGLPWKLLDPGVNYTKLDVRTTNGKSYNGVLITFDHGIGETPEDWYRFYFDNETGRMYSVLFKEHAVENPGVFWLDFVGEVKVDGIYFPKKWNYYTGAEDGTRGRFLKTVDLLDVRFTPTTNSSAKN